jgi:hypothetical protein
MKVQELIAILQELNPGSEVVMSKDAEGNEYSPCANYGEAMYDPETTWYGTIYTPGDDDYIPETAIKYVILWPTN